jgi:hypothetical protein
MLKRFNDKRTSPPCSGKEDLIFFPQYRHVKLVFPTMPPSKPQGPFGRDLKKFESALCQESFM